MEMTVPSHIEEAARYAVTITHVQHGNSVVSMYLSVRLLSLPYRRAGLE